MAHSDSRPQRLYILTGEPSGEAHAARVGRIRDQWPKVDVRGIEANRWKLRALTS